MQYNAEAITKLVTAIESRLGFRFKSQKGGISLTKRALLPFSSFLCPEPPTWPTATHFGATCRLRLIKAQGHVATV